MKKNLFFAALVAAVAIVGCGANEAENQTASAQDEKTLENLRQVEWHDEALENGKLYTLKTHEVTHRYYPKTTKVEIWDGDELIAERFFKTSVFFDGEKVIYDDNYVYAISAPYPEHYTRRL